MTSHSPTRRTHRARRAVAAAAAALALCGAVVAPASAAPPSDRATQGPSRCGGVKVPFPKISFQLYGARAWIAQVGLEEVLATLADIGYRQVQPYAATYDVPAAEFEALLDKYGLKASSGQARYTDATFDSYLAYAKDIGQRYTGSGGFPAPGIASDGTSSYADAIATAQAMDRLGERSVRNGTGKLFGHNHYWEFTTMVTDPTSGETSSAWEVIAANTDPRWVTFEVDVFWTEYAGVDTVELLEEYGDRIELLHIKDATAPYSIASQTDVGEGDIDWAPILEAARGSVRSYVIETDLTPTDREFAEDSFDFLSCSSR